MSTVSRTGDTGVGTREEYRQEPQGRWISPGGKSGERALWEPSLVAVLELPCCVWGGDTSEPTVLWGLGRRLTLRCLIPSGVSGVVEGSLFFFLPLRAGA